MTDPVNKKYGVTDEAVEAEIMRLQPVLEAWAKEDALRHPAIPVSDEEIAERRERGIQGKANSAMEGIYPEAAEEAMFELFDRLRWDSEKGRRYLDTLDPVVS
jgi:hypothetical protein